MAIIYQATLVPTKTELVGGWAPSQPWFVGDAAAGVTSVGAYRFDDPEGEVGIETLLVRAGDGPVLQVPLTYRAASLEGAEAFLIGTMQHSVLGERFVYDAVGDPVYVAAVATAALTGGSQADHDVQTADGAVKRALTTFARGSGSPDAPPVTTADIQDIATRSEPCATVIEAGHLRVTVLRELVAGEPSTDAEGSARISGTWPDQTRPTTLALVVRA